MVRNLQYLTIFVSTLFLMYISLFNLSDKQSLDTVFAQISNNNSLNDGNNTNTDKINDLLTQNQVLGIVKNGTFMEVETKLPLKLTDVGLVQAMPPEAGLLNLTQYEGNAIMVSTQRADGEWVWDANITEAASTILTKVINKVFNIQ
jgi:hypothetical protein